MSNMRNLTLASAKHLLTQGHITPAHHAKIVNAVKPKKLKLPAPRPPMFGSMAPQQAQAPIPAVGMGAPTIPMGTASGYDNG